MKLKYFSKNGKILGIKNSVISLLNIEYCYGFGVYETVRVNNNIPFFIEQHINRLFKSAQIIGLEHDFSKEKTEEYTKKLIKKLNVGTYNLKFLLLGRDIQKNSSIYILPSNPMFPDKKMLKNGTAVITVNFERVFPEAKTLNMLQSYIAYKNAMQNNCYDALIIDKNGFIREGTRTNFLMIKENTIHRAPKGTILEGVTQKVVLSVAVENGYKIQEANMKMENLGKFDGAFLTSTGIKIMPISKIDDIVLPIPENLKKLTILVDKYFDNCKGIFKNEK